MRLTLEQIKWCAEQVERQQDEPMAVYDMRAALAYAIEHNASWLNQPDGPLWFIRTLGGLVKPSTNGDFRTVPVTFGSLVGATSPEHIVRQLELLCDYAQDYGAGRVEIWFARTFYQLFENIHPFTDGNGRVGALLYNCLLRTLQHPVHAPEFTRATNADRTL